MFFNVYVLMLCTNVDVVLFLYWELMFQDLAVISLYMPKTIVSVVKKKNYHYCSTFGVIGVLHENVSLTYNC